MSIGWTLLYTKEASGRPQESFREASRMTSERLQESFEEAPEMPPKRPQRGLTETPIKASRKL